jgi:EAL domain-containing protein (putative c-di-GMP-specific phosphodiesterase class I)
MCGASPTWLEVEITESAVMADPERSMHTLTRLREMGIRISIDDFGTGYSSLAYLQRLPVDEIKIDKSFVTDMATNTDNAYIVRSIVDLGHNLGMQVAAEGVEDEITLDRLRSLGCDLAQGFYLCRPSTPRCVQEWIEAQSPARVIHLTA